MADLQTLQNSINESHALAGALSANDVLTYIDLRTNPLGDEAAAIFPRNEPPPVSDELASSAIHLHIRTFHPLSRRPR